MDCCNYGEYRGPGQYGAGMTGWDGYSPYTPLPYPQYAYSYYSPQAQDPYARYYRYDYPTHHAHHADHVMPMADYGAYASKEARIRRVLARRDVRGHTPAPHLSLPPSPALDCGMNGRGPTYCEPQMWSHYQMGLMGANGWSGGNAVGAWAQRAPCAREHMRYPPDCRSLKGPHLHAQSHLNQDGRSTPYPTYEDSAFNVDRGSKLGNTQEYNSSPVTQSDTTRLSRDRFYSEPQRSPPEVKRPPVVPLPAFQQAFGSTEIGKFSEAFTRTEVTHDDTSSENFTFESFPEWEGQPDPQWSSQPPAREIKCEDNY